MKEKREFLANKYLSKDQGHLHTLIQPFAADKTARTELVNPGQINTPAPTHYLALAKSQSPRNLAASAGE